MASSDPGLKPGDTVEGRYRIIRVLDEGGMGTILLAEHVLIKRRVAIKILRPELATDGSVVDRFMNEARAAGTLGHPNIIESTDMGFTREGVPFIVFEYLEGSLLTEAIYQKPGGMPVRRALKIADQIASALHAAHNAGIVHRDLKADNVFLTDREDVSDHVKVFDFGISRFLQADGDRSASGLVMGTPEFMAPEQVTNPDSVDHRADIWALGVILYEMLTATRPFRSPLNDPHAVLHQVVHDDPAPLSVPGAPPGLSEMILDKLLAKDPAKRYPSMKEAQGALEAFHGILRRETGPVATQEPERAAPASEPAKVIALPEPKKKSGVAWLAAALLAGAAGVGFMFAGNTQPAATAADDRPAMSALEADADKIATLIESEARGAHLRAEGIAQTPMLRAAIETDAATIKDMIHGSDFVLKPQKGEVLEVFQLRDGKTSSLMRIPETEKPLAQIPDGETRIATDGRNLAISVSTPVTTQAQQIGGSIVVSASLDLEPIRKRVAPHALGATLEGLSQPIVLVQGNTAAGARRVTVPVTTSSDVKTGALTLAAILPDPVAAPIAGGNPFGLARYAAWGAGGLLLVIYLVGLLRRRGQG
ncbi:MAG: serine/threonine protein kinase with repeat [Myxococcales bacterium]|nr:serine/threonine protein kinase with repeat [Myxococcales bacterium]